ncbi:SlyX family protein [Solemya velesiana gill symbiont]|uniref:Protein SlyX homolog n=1 Tax=Solemya velesiana gill symbiont TaxID=1918948 RepID=A0A1T2KYL4_9GAMM|nr:SlyX family protein [Solemya velesiana gill symbiont]OOZ37860.1 SlyX protein [Solemya velesiana gill symbiont]
MNEELIDLQTRLAFQDDAIQELNSTVARQQNQILELQKAIEQLRQQVKTLTPSQVASPDEEAPPPHY